MGHIFISYSHKDNIYAHKLQEALDKEGLDVWIDDRIDYGTQWPKVIQDQLDACSAFIVLVSQNSFESQWVQNELVRAQKRKKPLSPILIEGDLWLSLESTQFVDLSDGSLPSKRFFDLLAKYVGPIPPKNRKKKKHTFYGNLRNAFDCKDLEKAIEKEKDTLSKNLEQGIKKEVQSLSVSDILSFVLIDESTGITIRKIGPSATKEYTQIFSSFMKQKQYESLKVESYVNPCVYSKVKSVFLEFYSDYTLQKIIVDVLTRQLKDINEFIATQDFREKESIAYVIDSLIKNKLKNFINDSTTAESLKISTENYFGQLQLQSLINATIVGVLAALVASIGLVSTTLVILPVTLSILFFAARNLKSKLSDKIASEVCGTVASTYFSNMNSNISKILVDDLYQEVVSGTKRTR